MMVADSLKVIFAGTPAFAATALTALMHSSHQVIAVYTQQDKPAGRGLKLMPSPVKALALQHQLPLYQPVSLKEEQEKELADLQADVMVVAAYGMLLPASILSIPRLGCVNIHPSLLPRWRGAAPIQRALYAGDAITGVTIMQMDAGLDTGPILLQQTYQPRSDETSDTLHQVLAELGAKTLIQALDLLAVGKIHAKPQDNHLSTYAHKITKEEALLDWTRPAVELEREIRAFNPWPIAYTTWQGQNLRIFAAKVVSDTSTAIPRTLVHASHQGIDIATGKGVLRLLQLQLPGGKVVSAADFYNARRKELVIGQHFL